MAVKTNIVFARTTEVSFFWDTISAPQPGMKEVVSEREQIDQSIPHGSLTSKNIIGHPSTGRKRNIHPRREICIPVGKTACMRLRVRHSLAGRNAMRWCTVTAVSNGAPGRIHAQLECGHVAILRIADLTKRAAEEPSVMIGNRRPCKDCDLGVEPDEVA